MSYLIFCPDNIQIERLVYSCTPSMFIIHSTCSCECKRALSTVGPCCHHFIVLRRLGMQTHVLSLLFAFDSITRDVCFFLAFCNHSACLKSVDGCVHTFKLVHLLSFAVKVMQVHLTSASFFPILCWMPEVTALDC